MVGSQQPLRLLRSCWWASLVRPWVRLRATGRPLGRDCALLQDLLNIHMVSEFSFLLFVTRFLPPVFLHYYLCDAY